MAVAPSFQRLELAGEPFAEGDKEYVMVRYPDGHTRKVRWYEEPMKKIRSTKEVLGFSKGYITIFKGDTYSLLEWFRSAEECRYHSLWGWYVPSELTLPIIPAGIEPIKLQWADIAFEDEDALKGESAIKEHIDTLMYDPSPSKWQGEVGDRIDRLLTVTKIVELDGYYGPSCFFLFEDEDKNEYTWTTSAKKLELGETYEIRGTIKQLSKYKGKEQTVLIRCKVN